jgi:CRP-like cAMP-binding protein
MADEGLRDRLTRQGEDAIGKLAQDLLENPLVNSAISRAFEARERATQAQEAALGALNIPTAADVERLTRRLRSVSQRLEGIEDGVDRLDQRIAALKGDDANPLAAVGERLTAIESQLTKLSADVSLLAGAVDAAPRTVPREQERFEVDKAPPAKARKPRTKKSASV